MKKLFLFLLLAVSMSAFGQNKVVLADIPSVTFYGIDYSRARVYGGTDSGQQYKYTYDDINKLFITQPKRYDVGKNLGIKVDMTSLEAVEEVNRKVNPEVVKITNNDYILSEKDIAEMIMALPILSREERTGLVMIAMLMDRENARATYQFVVFNTRTRDIITQWTTEGKAPALNPGLSLRNYWAWSVHSALKKLK